MGERDVARSGGWPWRWILGGLALLLVLSALTFMWWMRSTSDLDALEAQARAAGIDLSPPLVDPATDLAWESFRQRIPTGFHPLPTVQLPMVMKDSVVAVLDDPATAALLDEFDRIPPGRVAEDRWGLDGFSWLIAMEVEHVAPDRIPGLVQRLARADQLVGPRRFRLYERGMSLWLLLHALCVRHAAGDLPREPAMIVDLMAMGDQYEADLRSGGAVAFRQSLGFAREGNTAFYNRLGIRLPELLSAPPVVPVVMRAGREAYLSELLAWHLAASRTTGLAGLVQTAKARHVTPAGPSLSAMAPSTLLASWAAVAHEIQYGVGIILHLRMLIAELGGTPWPLDPYVDPPAPLRRVERDGILIGAYSPGRNGVDDGGDRQLDRCFPLAGIMGWPRMGDPPVKNGNLWK